MDNSSIMGFNIALETKQLIKDQAPVPWIRGLDIWALKLEPMTMTQLRELNITPLINTVQQQLRSWDVLKLSWFGRITALKMIIIPKFTFLFRSLILALPRQVLNEIQRVFNNFIWAGKTSTY